MIRDSASLPSRQDLDDAQVPSTGRRDSLEREAKALSLTVEDLVDEMRDDFDSFGPRRLPPEPQSNGALGRLSYWAGGDEAELIRSAEAEEDSAVFPENKSDVSYENPLAKAPNGHGLRQRVLSPHKFVWVTRRVDRPIGVRMLPDPFSPKTGAGLYPGELVEVDRVALTYPGNEPFYHVADARREGWVFVYHPISRQRLLKVAEGTLLTLPPNLTHFVYSKNTVLPALAAREGAERLAAALDRDRVSCTSSEEREAAEDAESLNERIVGTISMAMPTLSGADVDEAINFRGPNAAAKAIGVRCGPSLSSTGPGTGISPGQVFEATEVWIPDRELPLPAPWVEVEAPDGSGDVYYWNTDTDLTQWERPLPESAGDVYDRVAAATVGDSPRAFLRKHSGGREDEWDDAETGFVPREDDSLSEEKEMPRRRSTRQSIRLIRKKVAKATGMHGAFSRGRDRQPSRQKTLASLRSLSPDDQGSTERRSSMLGLISDRFSRSLSVGSGSSESSLSVNPEKRSRPLRVSSGRDFQERSASPSGRWSLAKKIRAKMDASEAALPDFGDNVYLPYLRLAGNIGWVLMQHPRDRRQLICNVPVTTLLSFGYGVDGDDVQAILKKSKSRGGVKVVKKKGVVQMQGASHRSFLTPLEVRSLASIDRKSDLSLSRNSLATSPRETESTSDDGGSRERGSSYGWSAADSQGSGNNERSPLSKALEETKAGFSEPDHEDANGHYEQSDFAAGQAAPEEDEPDDVEQML